MKHIAYLDTSMRAEIEVKLVWVSDPHVYSGACRNVATTTNLLAP